MCFDFLYNFHLNTYLSKKSRARYYQILMKLELSCRFSKKTEISNFMKIRPLGAEFLNAGRETNMTTLIVAFCNFANAPKMFLSHLENIIRQVYRTEIGINIQPED